MIIINIFVVSVMVPLSAPTALLLLLLTDKNHFEVGFLREPLVPESFEPLFRHVMIYQEIVDTLELAPNRGL